MENKGNVYSSTEAILAAHGCSTISLSGGMKGESMQVWLEKGAVAPVREHSTDAGIDLFTPEDAVVEGGGSVVVDTGVHVKLPKGCCGVLVSKSGLNVGKDITSTGLIDEGYTGSIKVKLYNHGGEKRLFQRGDKVSQLVIVPVKYEKVEVVGEATFKGMDRGDGGFGSTGW